jgi:hypothetical protein
MVVVTREFRDRSTARTIIMSLEVPEDVLLQSERANVEPDWLGVVYALDRVFLSHGGAMGQCRFLNERSKALDGKTPIEALRLPGGPTRFCHAASVFADGAL